jgi:predicted nucleic acid-binding Zn ribbon protein
MLQGNKQCIDCGAPLNGRADKRFCDDYCRNHYNNRMKSGSNNLIRNINNALKKNRNVLSSLLNAEDDTTKVSRERLLESGFLFKYGTHSYTNKKGNVYIFCYDYGYLKLDNDVILIVRHKNDP